jgi:hypothetical protein
MFINNNNSKFQNHAKEKKCSFYLFLFSFLFFLNKVFVTINLQKGLEISKGKSRCYTWYMFSSYMYK